MHDKYGRQIAEGDTDLRTILIVVAHSWLHGKVKPQKVVACNEQAQSCNVILDHGVHGANLSSSNAKDCVLAVKADGTIVPLPEEASNV